MQKAATQLLLSAFAIFLAACGNEPKQSDQGAGETPPSIVETGKAIFRQNCSTCHLLNGAATGPALQGVLTRWNGDSTQLKAFIHNPSKQIASKEPHALQAYQKSGPTMMTAFPNLSDADLNALIAYFQSNP